MFDSTAGGVQFLGREPLAILDTARPEWFDVARHPLGGGGIEDLLTGKGIADSRLKRAAKCWLGVLSSRWASLFEDEHACGWIANCIGYGFTQVGIELGKEPKGGGQIHILQEEWGLLDVVRVRWALLARSAHGRAVLRAAHPALGPEACCAIAEQHADFVYELSHTEEGAALVRTLLRQVRGRGCVCISLRLRLRHACILTRGDTFRQVRAHPERAHAAGRAIVGERWAAMATHEHAHAVVCALGPLVPLEILTACAAPSAGALGREGEGHDDGGDGDSDDVGVRAMAADRYGAKVLKSVLMVLDGTDADARRAMQLVGAWAVEWVGTHPEPPQQDAATGQLGAGWEQADLVKHFVKRCKMRDMRDVQAADERLVRWAGSIPWQLDPRDSPNKRGRGERGGRGRGRGGGRGRGRGGGRRR